MQVTESGKQCSLLDLLVDELLLHFQEALVVIHHACQLFNFLEVLFEQVLLLLLLLSGPVVELLVLDLMCHDVLLPYSHLLPLELEQVCHLEATQLRYFKVSFHRDFSDVEDLFFVAVDVYG